MGNLELDGAHAAAWLAGLLDSAMDAIITVDEAQRIVLYNRAAERIFGWPALEMLGAPMHRLLPERYRAAHAEHLRRFGATGSSSRRMSGSAVVHGLRASGEEFPVDASISQLATSQGKLFTVILRDVSQRVESEQLQSRLAARLSGLLESAMDAIITIDANERIILYNRAAERTFGWPAGQVMGRNFDMLMPQRFRGAHRAHVSHFDAAGVTSRRMGDRAALVGLRASGEEFPIELSISQLDTPEGKLFNVVLRDVTDRVRAQEELGAFAAEATGIRERERSRIARELHDGLAQTLIALKMDATWVRDRSGDAPSVREKLAAMLSTLDQAVADIRRIAADLRPPLLDHLGWAPALQWLAVDFTERTGIQCELELADAPELPEPYATALFRIVQELLVNVAEHSGARRVRVRVRRDPGGLVASVEDDGNGFDPSDPRKPQSLGLVGVRERARLLGGSVVIAGEPGKGTRVEARIPMEGSRAGQ